MSNYTMAVEQLRNKKLVEAYQLDNTDALKTLIQKTKEREEGKITNTEDLSRDLLKTKERKSVVRGETWRGPPNKEDQKEKR